MGFVGALFGKPNFNNLVVTCAAAGDEQRKCARAPSPTARSSRTIVNFLIVAFAVFIIDQDVREAAEDAPSIEEPEPEPLTRSEELLTEIRDSLQQAQ